MAATGIVIVFSALSAASKGSHGSVNGLLSMLSAMRWVICNLRCITAHVMWLPIAFWLGLGLERNTLADLSQHLSSRRNLLLATPPDIGGLPWPQVRAQLTHLNNAILMTCKDAMIDFGFVIAAFVPLVLFWMSVLLFLPYLSLFKYSPIALVMITSMQSGGCRSAWPSFHRLQSSSGA